MNALSAFHEWSMMTRWLNEDLDLKQRVLNLEHDFSNGYLLGEVLHVHNHQHDFNLFQVQCKHSTNLTPLDLRPHFLGKTVQ